MDEAVKYKRTDVEERVVLETRNLSVFFAGRVLIRDINLKIPARKVSGIIGPSGAGKSTLLRCLNRLIELDPALKVKGDALLHRRSIYDSDVDVDALRAKIGMLFQQPVIFPASIHKNVLFGARHLRRLKRSQADELVEKTLIETALWAEVKDRLREPALKLSVGQQQRLCLARTLALDPEIILMDEPTSSLDVKSTEAIEQLIARLSNDRTIVLVTHNLDQARRVADFVTVIDIRDGAGEVIQSGPSRDLLGKAISHGSK